MSERITRILKVAVGPVDVELKRPDFESDKGVWTIAERGIPEKTISFEVFCGYPQALDLASDLADLIDQRTAARAQWDTLNKEMGEFREICEDQYPVPGRE